MLGWRNFGRRAGLRSQWASPCRFESGPEHHRSRVWYAEVVLEKKEIGRFLVYEDKTFDASKGTPVMVVYCLRCGHHRGEHLPGRDGCRDDCGCRDWDPSDPTPLRGKSTLEEGFVYAPRIPEGVIPVGPR